MEEYENETLDSYLSENNNNSDNNNISLPSDAVEVILRNSKTTVNNSNVTTSSSTTTVSTTNINLEEDEEEVQRRIDEIKPHYSTEEELLQFKIEDTVKFIDRLEKSNIELANAYIEDPDPIYYEAMSENTSLIEKKKNLLKDLELLLLEKQGLFM